MNLFFYLFMGIILGALSASLAKKRGLNPNFWFCIGLLFGALGICMMFFLPKKISEPSPIPIPPASPKKNIIWYYLDQNQTQCGPISENFLQELFQKNTISEETYLWCEDMDNWERYKEIFAPR